MLEKSYRFKRGNFFTGLMATPNFWNDITDYNLNKEQLYNRLFHGIGIVPGAMDELKVSSIKKGGNLTIVVGPGIALDETGRSLFLYDPQAKVIDYKKYTLPTTIYVTIQYNEVLDEYYQSKENPEYQGYQKKIETALIDISTKKPDNKNKLELARVYLEEDENGEIKEILEPEDITNPQKNEIDTRFVNWLAVVKKGLSPYLKKYLTDVLRDIQKTSSIANDAVSLSGLRDLQTIALTAKMLVECGDVAYDDTINILYPIYDISNHIIQEMLDYDRNHEKRVFSVKESFNDYRTRVHEMGDLIKYFDNTLENIDKVLRCLKAMLDAIKDIIVFKRITFEDIALISYDLPRILVIEDERYTLVEYLDFNDFNTEKAHDFITDNAKDYTSNKQAFLYPDGIEVKDSVKRYVGGKISFTIRNLVKKRDLLMIRRTDIFHGNYKVNIELNGESVKELVIDGFDSKNRWRNLSVLFEEALIKDSSVTISFEMGQNGRDNFGKIWFYQKL